MFLADRSAHLGASGRRETVDCSVERGASCPDPNAHSAQSSCSSFERLHDLLPSGCKKDEGPVINQASVLIKQNVNQKQFEATFLCLPFANIMLMQDNNHQYIVDLAASHVDDKEQEAAVSPKEQDNKDQQQQHQALSQKSHNVWYRKFLKPLIRDSRKPTYKDSFERRIVHSVGVPVEEIEGLHAMFQPHYRHYSPLQGMIFSYNNFVNNLYRYGDEQQEPAVALIQQLFHVLPGGEIQPTHAGRNAGAHLTPGLIGNMFEELEHVKAAGGAQTLDSFRSTFSERLAEIISQQQDYRENTEKLQSDVEKAELALKELQQKEDDAAQVRQRIKELEGDVIKANRHQIKRLKKELKKADETRKLEIEADIAKRNHQNEETEQELAVLRTQIVTSLDFKLARKALKRAQDAVDLERQSRVALAQDLAKSFAVYEFDFQDAPVSHLPKLSTTAILLSYLWRKYDSISAFEGYFEAMARIQALNVPLATVMELVHAHSGSHSSDDSESSERVVPTTTTDPSTSLELDSSSNNSRRGRRRRHLRTMVWSPAKIERAARITTGNPGNNDRPAVIIFSYVTWAAYSEFPDCGETALRNLFNQLVYNPDTGKFDYQVLEELKEKYYPEMSDLLINFYKKNDKPQDSANSSVAVEWIDVVSKLNAYRGWTKDHAMHIKYRREKEEQNIASPLHNALKVMNALFGVVDMEGADLVHQIAEQINDLRDLDLAVDLSGVKNDGFGILALTADGKVRYELQSYKPVHFGFVQAERLNNHSESVLSAGRREFRAFRRLMRHSNLPPRASDNTSEYFQQLALASLFVPYTLRRDTLGRFFRHTPPHYSLLFADFDIETHKQEALKWASSHDDIAQDAQVQTFLERLENYVEPEFAPKKKEAKAETEQE